MVEPQSSNFRVITTSFLGVRIFRKFTVDSDTCFSLELPKDAWECRYNTSNIEENGKDYQPVFDTDPSLAHLSRRLTR